jgi:hypothetical protein
MLKWNKEKTKLWLPNRQNQLTDLSYALLHLCEIHPLTATVANTVPVKIANETIEPLPWYDTAQSGALDVSDALLDKMLPTSPDESELKKLDGLKPAVCPKGEVFWPNWEPDCAFVGAEEPNW